MEIKRKGILAVPGEYTYGDRKEKKTAEELKAAALRQPRIPLTFGHPHIKRIEGIEESKNPHLLVPDESDIIGWVYQEWNEKKQRVDGDFSIFEEAPADLHAKLIREWPLPISAGFLVDRVEDGIQKGIFYTHVALLKDTEDPVCPLHTCGVNVRMESNPNGPDYRFEQAQSSADPEPKPKKEPEKTASVVSDEPLWAKELREQIKAALDRLPVAQKQEETKKTPEVEEIPEETAAPVEPPIPKKVIPAGPSTAKKGNLNADGWFEFSTAKK